MEVRLTRRLVETAEPPATGHLWLRDTDRRGLSLRVWRGARGHVFRAYILSWPDGRGGTRTTTIGHHGAPWRPHPETGEGRTLSLELAREEAVRLQGGRIEGRDPAFARRAPLTIPSLEEFEEIYLSDWVDLEKAPRSRSEDRGNLRRHIRPILGTLRLDRVGPEHVTALKRALREHPTTANRCLALLSHMLEMARIWRILPAGHVNPCRDVPHFEEVGRERALTVEELGRVGEAMRAEEDRAPAAVAAIRVLVLTGARPVEILGLRREDLPAALATGVIVRPSLKVGKKRRHRRPIYLNPFALDVLAHAPAQAGNPYVFPGGKEETHLTIWGLEGAWERIRAAAAVTDVRLYDLRHTFGTTAGELVAHFKHVQDLMGHADPRTTQKYVHLGVPLLRAASETVGGKIADALQLPKVDSSTEK